MERHKMSKELVADEEGGLDKSVKAVRHLSAKRKTPGLPLPFRQAGKTRRHDFVRRSYAGRKSEAAKLYYDALLLHAGDEDNEDDEDDAFTHSRLTMGEPGASSGQSEVGKGSNASAGDQTGWELEVRAPSPTSLLGPGEGDPFFVLPSDLPRRFVDERLYSARSIIADMVSRGPSGETYGKAFASNIMCSITSSPALFYAMMVGESMYSRAQKRLPHSSSVELEVGARAVRYISLEMCNPIQAVSDANIWAVLTLGYSGKLAPLRVGTKYPRQSFLKELQSIHIYCRMQIVYAHVLGLMKLVELLGGVQKIKTPGMAQVISLCGIIGACITVQTPLYPFVAHTDSFMLNGRLSVYDQERLSTEPTLGRLGSGFPLAWESVFVTDVDEITTVIRHICDFTIIIECYVQGIWMPRTFTTIIDQRNFVQHRLMSLKSTQPSPDTGKSNSDSIYESCRLAAIIYSFFVIFPLPPIIGPFEILTERLKHELSTDGFRGGEQSTRRLHLWVLAMGAIAAIDLPLRSWFLSEIRSLSAEVGLRDWEGLKRILETFLWHPSTNDPDGEDIWSDIGGFV